MWRRLTNPIVEGEWFGIFGRNSCPDHEWKHHYFLLIIYVYSQYASPAPRLSGSIKSISFSTYFNRCDILSPLMLKICSIRILVCSASTVFPSPIKIRLSSLICVVRVWQILMLTYWILKNHVIFVCNHSVYVTRCAADFRITYNYYWTPACEIDSKRLWNTIFRCVNRPKTTQAMSLIVILIKNTRSVL